MPQMPVMYPTEANFPADRIRQQDWTTHWQRNPGSGGQNYGQNYSPGPGYFVIGWDYEEHSNIRSSGRHDSPVFEARGSINVPVAIGNGTRLEPQGSLGGGASRFAARRG